MASNPVWEICERVAEVQALLDDHINLGKHSAADVVAKRKPCCRKPSCRGRCSMSATSRRTRRRPTDGAATPWLRATRLQQAQFPHQICNDGGEKCSDHYDGYGKAKPTQQSDYPNRSKFTHGDNEPNSFDRHVAFTVSLEFDDIPSAQNSLQTNASPTRQALTP